MANEDTDGTGNKAELLKMAEKWRSEAFEAGSGMYAEGKSECANELEEWINSE